MSNRSTQYNIFPSNRYSRMDKRVTAKKLVAKFTLLGFSVMAILPIATAAVAQGSMQKIQKTLIRESALLDCNVRAGGNKYSMGVWSNEPIFIYRECMFQRSEQE